MKRDIPVWDLPTRLFHWSLVVLMACAWASYKLGDAAMTWHKWNGYAILTLVVFRLLWGVAGSSTSRFAGFVAGPATVLGYARDMAKGRERHYLGHNPLGGLMVVALLAAILVQGTLGLFANDDVMASGPLRHTVSDAVSARLSTAHKIGFWIILAMVAAHVSAVLAHLLVKRDNLIRPMLTGTKRVSLPDGVATPVLRPPALALAALAVAAGLVWGGIQSWPTVAQKLLPPAPAAKEDW
jgi:cytochrome b